MPKKYRMHSWWWGRYVYRVGNGRWKDEEGGIYNASTFSEDELEEYDEELHGIDSKPHQASLARERKMQNEIEEVKAGGM